MPTTVAKIPGYHVYNREKLREARDAFKRRIESKGLFVSKESPPHSQQPPFLEVAFGEPEDDGGRRYIRGSQVRVRIRIAQPNQLKELPKGSYRELYKSNGFCAYVLMVEIGEDAGREGLLSSLEKNLETA